MENLTTALPITSDDLSWPQTLKAQYFTAEDPNSIPARGRKLKMITESDWPALKPHIYRLYIGEDLTFTQVTKALHLEFGFKITKRQFTRKIEKWGFRKNFRKDEREELLKGGDIPGRFIHDSRVNPKRVKRLQKRNCVSTCAGLGNYGSEVPLIQHRILSQTTKIVEEDLRRHIGILEDIPNSDDQDDTIMIGTVDPWPFGHAAEDSSRYVWLSQLFAQLEIEEIMASTSIDNVNEEDVEGRQFISGMELKELSNLRDNSLTCVELCSAQQHLLARNASSQAHNLAAQQSSWSPLFEIDIFPMMGNSNSRRQKIWASSWEVMEREKNECWNKLSRLKQLLPGNSSAIISTLERLASIYHEIHNPQKCKRVYKELIHARQKDERPNICKMVEAILWIISSCIDEGNFRSGMYLHSIIHPRIDRNLDRQHPLHLHSSYLRARTCCQLSRYHDAEAIIRPVLQISLVSLGPNHQFTINAMDSLAIILQTIGMTAEAERLARYNLQTSEKKRSFRDWTQNALVLTQILKTGRFDEERINLVYHTFKQMQGWTGTKNHTAYVSFHQEIASVILDQGKVFESVDIGRKLLRHTGRCSKLLLGIMLNNGLACALCKQGKIWESAFYYEESLKSAIEKFGWGDENVFMNCRNIGSCYQNLLQYCVALEFYERFLEKLRGSGKEHPSIEERIVEVEDWIYDVRGKIEKDNESSNRYGEDETGSHVTEMEDCGIDEENEDHDIEFKGRGLSLDDIFKLERDTSEDIGFEELGLPANFMENS